MTVLRPGSVPHRRAAAGRTSPSSRATISSPEAPATASSQSPRRPSGRRRPLHPQAGPERLSSTAGRVAGEGTFRDLEITDDRPPPKAPIFAFGLDGRPRAIAHRDFADGRLVDIPGAEHRLLIFRPADAAVYASSEALLVDSGETAGRRRVRALLAVARAGEPGFSPVGGFDTFWYTWVGAHPGTGLLRP